MDKRIFQLLAGIALLWPSADSPARPLYLSAEQLASPPPRIIRSCCSFGSELRLAGIPLVRITDISSPDQIGPHQYLGHRTEGNGIIYTRRGGFVDLGHLRDQADWTAYIHAVIRKGRANGGAVVKLGHEGGTKSLTFKIPESFTRSDEILLAGKIAYDLSVWHEIATYFGASTIPMVPERYSSFSVEDAYSNLLGARLGMKALASELPFEEAMTELVAETIEKLGAVLTMDETYAAMEDVHDLWWTRSKALPSRQILLEHHLEVYDQLEPWLVSGWGEAAIRPVVLSVPAYNSNGQALTDFYQLDFRLNHKFPFKKLYPERKRRFITQNDFRFLLAYIGQDISLKKKIKARKRANARRLNR